MLQGRSAPPLTGDEFLSNWETLPLLELANKVGKTMPKDDTPRLGYRQRQHQSAQRFLPALPQRVSRQDALREAVEEHI
jgi:hypothetical protein